MKQYLCLAAIALLQLGGPLFSMTLIPANHPFIQYVGRWDLTDSLHPKHSWPGVYIIVSFTGSSIGIRSNDATNYYNVYIDGTLHRVFHGEKQGDADYILADSLGKGEHTLMLSKRNISFDEIFTVSGFLLDDGARLLPPPPLPARRIEFVGDSFTAAESNEATAQSLPWVERFPVTNIDKGFGPVIARHYGAQYHTTCRSGGGMYCDWQGIRDLTLPERFNRTLMERDTPKWDFKQWVPDLVMVCLGLNDYSGLKGKDGIVPEEKSLAYRAEYRAFLARLRSVYPGVKILAVAAPPGWIRRNVGQVVAAEKAEGRDDIYYAQFDEFPGGYVANGHPTVETHGKIAGQIIAAIDAAGIFPETVPR
jgi:hypothetical protein